jgi:hypothetical protein
LSTFYYAHTDILYTTTEIWVAMANTVGRATGSKSVNAFPTIVFLLTLGLAIVIKMGWI